VVFLSPRANVELAPKIHVALLASHAALPNTKFEISVKMQSSERDKDFVTLRSSPPNTKLSPKANFFPLLHPPNSPLPIPLPSSLPIIVPYYQRIYQKDKRALPGNLHSSQLF